MMTIEDFIEKLRANAANMSWEQTCSGCLRGTDGSHRYCPISAVTGKEADYADVIAAGMRIGLSEDDARAILRAADNDGWLPPRDLRAKLLAAVGLS